MNESDRHSLLAPMLWPKDFAETTPWQFFRNRIVFTIGLDTFIALLITMLEPRWSGFLINFIFGQCIGFSILTLISFIYFPASRSFKIHYLGQITIYFVLVPIGIVGGAILGAFITGRTVSPFDTGSKISLGHFQWLNWAVPVVFSIIAAVIAYLYNIGRALIAEREKRAEQAERTAVEAQLKVLQAQIEPHFLFNTLATLDALIVTDRDGARAMLQHLIKYLRAALSHSRSDKATLGNEVDLLKAYLAIMALRLPNRLQTKFDCDAECLKLVFPPMLLQPLVENAITHGIEPAKAGGTIAVLARCADGTLDIAVEDSGVGLGNSPTAGTGAGTENVRRRLESLFGSNATLELEPLAPHGTRSRIRVPLDLLAKAPA
jgi:hypothetical protein